MLICGICCLIYPIAAGVYLSYATGFMFLVCGFILFIACLAQVKTIESQIYLCLLLSRGYCWVTVSGESCDRHEFIGNGILLPVYSGGIFRIASGVKLFHSPGYGWNIFIGILTCLLPACG